MNANPILLQKKYADVISCFARKENISLDQAMDIFYRSEVYRLIREGVSDMPVSYTHLTLPTKA